MAGFFPCLLCPPPRVLRVAEALPLCLLGERGEWTSVASLRDGRQTQRLPFIIPFITKPACWPAAQQEEGAIGVRKAGSCRHACAHRGVIRWHREEWRGLQAEEQNTRAGLARGGGGPALTAPFLSFSFAYRIVNSLEAPGCPTTAQAGDGGGGSLFQLWLGASSVSMRGASSGAARLPSARQSLILSCMHLTQRCGARVTVGLSPLECVYGRGIGELSVSVGWGCCPFSPLDRCGCAAHR
ncbi:hypothetical protein Efla_002294 [Eimeria flavescens]